MIAINDVLISEDIIEKNFICNLDACKGACCWEGDYGAPVTQKEADDIEKHLHEIKPFLPEESVNYLKRSPSSKYYKGPKMLGTPLLRNKRCVYLTEDEKGVSLCGIEKAHKEGATSINKPISCHLYPIRVLKNEDQGFEAWNYDRWDICSAACKLGDKHKVRIYAFLKDAIIRYKGAEFYEQLDAMANDVDKE